MFESLPRPEMLCMSGGAIHERSFEPEILALVATTVATEHRAF